MVTLDKIVHLACGSGFDISMSPMDDINSIEKDKIFRLGRGTRYDVCASSASPKVVKGNGTSEPFGSVVQSGICHAYTSGGRCVSLFKTLYTNECSHGCSYCSNASSCSKGGIYSYTPEELAKITLSLYRGNYIEGLFLSSGVGRDVDLVMEGMIETVRLLRDVYGFVGYIHLKILPGTSRDLIDVAIPYANRVSINLETSSASRLSEISCSKDYSSDLLQRQLYIKDITRKISLPAGQTTQFIIGAAAESDYEVFQRVISQYSDIGIKRAYYSAFTPITGTDLAHKKGEPAWREHRLYQMDWLYRVYKFPPSEIDHAFNDDGFLLNRDPKVAIAENYLDFPINVNEASFDELIRVPGIGHISAKRILILRRGSKIVHLRELVGLGVKKRAFPYLVIDGWVQSKLGEWS